MILKHSEGVAGTVSHGEYDVIAGDEIIVVKLYARNPLVFQDKVGDFRLKAELSSQGLDGGPHVFDDFNETESSDMGFRQVEYLFGGSCFHEFGQNFSREVTLVLDLAV